MSDARTVWAEQIIASQRRAGKGVPARVNLTSAITTIQITDAMPASTIEIGIVDDGWDLVDSGFFDADRDGRLDPIDVNYPDGSRLWWRLTQVTLSDEAGPPTLTLTFMSRAAVFLMAHRGPFKASRKKRTRAQFLKMLTDQVQAGGGITFHSRELGVRQPIAADPKVKQTAAQRRAAKGGGINPSARVVIQGIDANVGQKRQAERALDVATGLEAPELAVKAMVVAAIGESGFKAIRNQGHPPSPYWGVFQGSMSVFAIDDTEGMAESFLKGGKGYNGGGAIALANAHPDWTPGHIALVVEGSRPNFASEAAAEEHYQKWAREAELILDAYGGASFGSTVYRKQANFQVGTSEQPHETFWDAAVRLAGEVQWAWLIDGNDAYYDAETELIKQTPIAVLERGDPVITNFSVTWDARHIASEVTVDVLCDPFEFRAGEVFQLHGFGPASTGSTAKLPGRWLISESDRSPFEQTTSFTLRQPTRPKKEPRTQLADRAPAPVDAGGDITGSPKDIVDNVALPIGAAAGVPLTPIQVSAANKVHGPTKGGTVSDHQGNGQDAWAVDFPIGPDIRGGTNPSGAKKGDAIAKALAEKFDITWTGSGIAQSIKEVGGHRFRFQIIWRFESAQAGNHYTHVHCGVRRL